MKKPNVNEAKYQRLNGQFNKILYDDDILLYIDYLEAKVKSLEKSLSDIDEATWVFRRYRQVESFNNAEDALIEEAFALHFVEPFKIKKEAQKAIDNAKLMQPWQEWVILYGY